MTALLLPGETLRVGVNVIVRPGDEGLLAGNREYVAPQDWVALAGPCPNTHLVEDQQLGGCRDCRDGRRIVPLYTECPHPNPRTVPNGKNTMDVCDVCRAHKFPFGQWDEGRVLVGRGSIEVVPVVEKPSDSPTKACLCPAARGMVLFWHDREPITADTTPEELHARSDLIGPFDPLPVPGRDFGIVIDCAEVV